MSLLPSTKSIVERLEALSQRPVHIIETAALETMADIKIARGNQPCHLLRYRPTSRKPADYVIAYQCGLQLVTQHAASNIFLACSYSAATSKPMSVPGARRCIATWRKHTIASPEKSPSSPLSR